VERKKTLLEAAADRCDDVGLELARVLLPLRQLEDESGKYTASFIEAPDLCLNEKSAK